MREGYLFELLVSTWICLFTCKFGEMHWKLMKLVSVYTLWMFVFCTICRGQNNAEQPKDDNRSVTAAVVMPHGPNTLVRTIRQDRKGNIWIAATEGIIRYDGKTFTNITSKVSQARFFCVLEDRKGNFWFASGYD